MRLCLCNGAGIAHSSGLLLVHNKSSAIVGPGVSKMRSSNLVRNISPMRARVFAPWNVFSALLLLPDQQSHGMMKRVFESFGINVHAASSVAEADQVTRSTRIDLAICD